MESSLFQLFKPLRLANQIFIILAIAMIISSSLIIASAESGTLIVRVLDHDTGKAIRNALVIIGGPEAHSSATDDKGIAYFTNIPEGNYSIAASHRYYHSSIVRVLVKGGEDVMIRLSRKSCLVTIKIMSIQSGLLMKDAIIRIDGPVDRIGGWEPRHDTRKSEIGELKLRLPAGTYIIGANVKDHGETSIQAEISEDRELSLFVASKPSSSLNPFLIISLGWIFSFINYYLGWTLIALPTAHRGMKSLGRMMVEDGASYAVMMSMYGLIFLIIHMVWQMIYGFGTTYYDAYARLNNFFINNFNDLAFILGGLTALSAILSIIRIPVHAMSPLWNIYGYSFSVNTFLFFGTAFILSVWPFMLSIGAILYGLPARIGRVAGAFLMSTSIVFFIGLPFMPNFVDFCTKFSVAGMEETVTTPHYLEPNMLAIPEFIKPILNWFTNQLKYLYIAGMQLFLRSLFFPLIYVFILCLLIAGLSWLLSGRSVVGGVPILWWL